MYVGLRNEIILHFKPPKWVKHVLKAFLVNIFIKRAPANGTAVLNIIVRNRTLPSTNMLTRHNRVCKQNPSTVTTCHSQSFILLGILPIPHSIQKCIGQRWKPTKYKTKHIYRICEQLLIVRSTLTWHNYLKSIFLQWLILKLQFCEMWRRVGSRFRRKQLPSSSWSNTELNGL
jgi:hypothetical protein